MKKASILIVEDEGIVAQDIKRFLSHSGYRVTAVVKNGKDALKEARANPPDLVLMDVVLEGEVDGIETARRMRSDQDIPIVYITAHSDKKTVEAAKTTEPYGYILKPIDEKELHIVVELTLHKHSLEKSFKDKVEQALRTSEDRYRMLVENMNEGIATVNHKGIISFINEKFLGAQGFTPEDVIGHSLAEFVGPKNLEVFQETIAKRGKGIPEPCELTWKKKGGGEAAILVSPAPIYEAGEFKGSIVVLTDISERRQIEEELGQSYQQLRNLSRHLQSVREEESKRIAREIHDELGQALTALKMDLTWLSSRFPESLPDQRILIDKTKAMTSLIDKTIGTVQKVSAELRPGLLDDLGLIPAIEWQCQDFKNRTGIKCKVDFDSEVIDLSPDLSTAIFRVFQEALTNAARHSRATRIIVSLKNRPGLLELQISDNGIGIPEKAVASAESLGIMGMRERLIPFGGTLIISGVANRGTTLTLRLPVEGPQAND
jgi:two-component system sensor histidine kinase UhpB